MFSAEILPSVLQPNLLSSKVDRHLKTPDNYNELSSTHTYVRTSLSSEDGIHKMFVGPKKTQKEYQGLLDARPSKGNRRTFKKVHPRIERARFRYTHSVNSKSFQICFMILCTCYYWNGLCNMFSFQFHCGLLRPRCFVLERFV